MVKVGLVTGPATPSARHAPRTNVVLPLPSSPLTSTRSPGRSDFASSAPSRSVSAEEAELLFIRNRLGVGFVCSDQLRQAMDVGPEEIKDRSRSQGGRRVKQRIQ